VAGGFVNGMACITEAATGFPNGNRHIPPSCATLAEVLVERGFSTAAVGKWHLTAEDEMNLVSTRRLAIGTAHRKSTSGTRH